MYKNHKILCVIPVRGGSKGLPGKNIKKLAGKPLIGHSIEHALGSRYIDRTVVSTDSRRISRIARRFGAEVPFLRPKRLATDKSGTIDVLLHAADWMERKGNFPFDILVLLHVTSPLRRARDVDKCIELLFSKGADNIFSVTEAHINPYFNMVEIKRSGKVALVKKGKYMTRQAAPRVYDMNSSIYVWRKAALKKKKSIFTGNTRVYIMPRERSVDIDHILDFKVAEAMLKDE